MPTRQGPASTITVSPDRCTRQYKTLDIALKRNHYQPDALIEVLHKAQESFGYLEDEVLLYIARQLKLPLSRVYGVASFYHLFNLRPSGVHRCVVCLGTACYVKGASQILSRLERDLQLKVGETTADGEISLLSARCLGACGIAPAVVLDEAIAGQQTPESVAQAVQTWSIHGQSSSLDAPPASPERR
ncbi:bidirectional hydrogenase complex protein HoxE [Lyngbya confervoides]|uniref:Bidirectional hydrogenase complex protein HoxE n=1 Tax=Lyngbya confervoides BDU141951 TaxID=1574623 RepID=A0ABD4T0E4_9CYAN|nr:bidirectional hydrogenase complex protein HoxE [Lyngbya confervoides]MCM1982126.1 bidirectional hydrogenase complex protein HoxE [Lyngbya confervoides BDU141951]